MASSERHLPNVGQHLAFRLGPAVVASASDHVPTGVMLDYAYGGLDDELLSLLYGSHLSHCPSCSRAVDVYRKKRPSDPARLYEVPELSLYQPKSSTYRLTPQEAGHRFARYLAEGTGSLLIVAGEANPEVFGTEIADAFRSRAAASRRSGDPLPQVICGPVMGLNERIQTPSETVLPTLAEEGVIKLYITRHRQRLHFRVSGEASVYTEEYHEAGNPGDRRGYWYESRPIANLFRRRFQAILDTGLAVPARRDDFVYLPMGTIRNIQRKIGERFDDLSAADLAGMAA